MIDYQLGAIEARFADLIWSEQPIYSSELVKRCEKLFGWKKSTTYTVLRRLCEKGIFENNSGIVTSVISKDEFYSAESRKYVDETFEGSLPAFIAAFTSGKKLKENEIDEIQKMIDSFRREV